MKLTALFFALFLMIGYYPAYAEEAPAPAPDCSVWKGVDCDALASSIKNGDGQFTQVNLDECLTCNPKPQKTGLF